MFLKNKVINEDKIKSAVECRHMFTYDYLKEEWCNNEDDFFDDTVLEDEFDFFDAYDSSFDVCLSDFSLAELEYVMDNNSFGFEKNNMLDFRCIKLINEKISEYELILNNITKSVQSGSMRGYFQKYDNIFEMYAQVILIEQILGLMDQDIELTPEGEMLKACMDEIRETIMPKEEAKENNVIEFKFNR